MMEKKAPLRWKQRPSPLRGWMLRRGETTLALVYPAIVNGWLWTVEKETGSSEWADRAKSAALAAVRRRGL
jgi:hypothetical protein